MSGRDSDSVGSEQAAQNVAKPTVVSRRSKRERCSLDGYVINRKSPRRASQKKISGLCRKHKPSSGGTQAKVQDPTSSIQGGEDSRSLNSVSTGGVRGVAFVEFSEAAESMNTTLVSGHSECVNKVKGTPVRGLIDSEEVNQVDGNEAAKSAASAVGVKVMDDDDDDDDDCADDATSPEKEQKPPVLVVPRRRRGKVLVCFKASSSRRISIQHDGAALVKFSGTVSQVMMSGSEGCISSTSSATYVPRPYPTDLDWEE